MGTHKENMEGICKLLKNPKIHLPKEKFVQWTKYAVIICNHIYDSKYTTMGNLPDVLKDMNTAK